MNRAILLFRCLLVIALAPVWLAIDAVKAGSSKTITPSVRFARCFQDSELSKSLATLKLQGQAEVAKVAESLLTKARTTPGCRTQVVQALISSMAQATNLAANNYENYFLWVHGASLLTELKATEALDLLIANIDLTDGWSASITPYHTPALVAIVRIGPPAIPKLQIALRNDAVPYKRKMAAFCIAYIGGSQARRALTNALPAETDPCVKNFLRLSLQAFNNKAKPNHISSALNGKWLSAFYCL
jgi:hypothetical protein